MSAIRAIVLACLVTALPAMARAQPAVGIRGYGSFGLTALAAADTFEAVADTSARPIFGGGVHVTKLWRDIFADVAVAQMRLDGQRLFILDGDVFELGIPLTVRLRPVDVAAGWRFTFRRLSPYAGGGITFLSYEETSDVAAASDDVSESRSGPLLLGGLDVRVWRWAHVGGEVRYRRVTGILGEGGVSAAFDDNDAGGISVGLRISIGR